MNYKKLILVGCISAFVAVLTSVLGVTGTIIGSVVSSVLYNMLSEALEKPVANASLKTDFEWEIAYVFPLAVIAIIQLLLIFALLSESGFLPHTFLDVFLSLQDFADNNLYRILGIALLVISAYPFVLKPDFVKKEHGLILVFVALIFLARGFVDMGNRITQLYNPIFVYFDLPIAILAFFLLLYVIIKILMSKNDSENDNDSTVQKRIIDGHNFHNPSDDWVYVNPNQQNVNRNTHNYTRRDSNRNYHSGEKVRHENNQRIVKHNYDQQESSGVKFKRNAFNQKKPNQSQVSQKRQIINESSKNIHFESNDLLDEYKK